ncbi:MAG: HAMP domain-containing histidine kinase [Hyphomonas sp.]|nr:HAMP domain-containing histidine kinase [Hyphomonas sp.]MCB9971038.1 HAMP domain-containing histidine kinase [Hyphomonas sp.]
MNRDARASLPAPARPPASARWFDSLSFRLFALTLASILFVEALIFVPSASGFRNAWLQERVQAARIAALALDAAPSRMVSDELARQLLHNAEVLNVSEMEDEMHFQLLDSKMPIEGTPYALDLRSTTMTSRVANVFGAFFAPKDRILVISTEGTAEGRIMEVVVPQAPLKADLIAYGQRIAGLSLLIGLIAATIIYVLLHFLVVRPMRRVTTSVEQFRMDPGSWTRRLNPTARRDEIGRAQNALADMEEAVADAFRQRAHLAELGTAVAKINHDLRNSLASAQLVSDMLARSDDPRVQKAAPRLERALTRAINLASETLDYGKAAPLPPDLQPVNLRATVDEAAAEALSAWPEVEFVNDLPPPRMVEADPEHLHRLATNLIRNAAEAMVSGASLPKRITVTLTPEGVDFIDTGPGLPASAQENLFRPFAASTRKTGTGLGLVIARELATGMGGDLQLAATGPTGTTFRLTLPDLAV